ncbi:MAG: type 1 glutamine amidotransferase [Pelagimonas sp.]|jgi:GMP synthase (glutamine-hydrolysing)|nr:type 1 glutamine amidotransferase [Pelagimonas sp.]
MKIGILQTGHIPDEMAASQGSYSDLFQAFLGGQGFDFETWNVVDGVFPDGPEAADGFLITGSRHGAYEDHPWIPPLEDMIRAIVAADRPLIGVCFGHQIIAQALGGKVQKYDGGWAIGPQDYDFPDGCKTVQAWHQDQVVTLPEGAEVLAGNDFCRNAAILYPGKAYTVQPHPEFDDSFIDGLMTHRAKGVVPDEVLNSAKSRMGTPLQRADLAQHFTRFFKERRLS